MDLQFFFQVDWQTIFDTVMMGFTITVRGAAQKMNINFLFFSTLKLKQLRVHYNDDLVKKIENCNLHCVHIKVINK